MFKSLLPKCILLILFLPLLVMAQSSEELRQKYKVSAVVESYEVRSGIIAAVFFGENGQAVYISIKPRVFYADDPSKNVLPLSIAEEILSELVPAEKRGKLCYDGGFQSGRNYLRNIMYENVDMGMTIHDRHTPKTTVSQMSIYWRKVGC